MALPELADQSREQKKQALKGFLTRTLVASLATAPLPANSTEPMPSTVETPESTSEPVEAPPAPIQEATEPLPVPTDTEPAYTDPEPIYEPEPTYAPPVEPAPIEAAPLSEPTATDEINAN